MCMPSKSKPFMLRILNSFQCLPLTCVCFTFVVWRRVEGMVLRVGW